MPAAAAAAAAARLSVNHSCRLLLAAVYNFVTFGAISLFPFKKKTSLKPIIHFLKVLSLAILCKKESSCLYEAD